MKDVDDTSSSYTRVAIALHWLMAIAVFMLFALGWFMVELPKGPDRGYYFALHKSIGLTVFAVLMGRIVWRLRHPPPPLPQRVPRWQRALSTCVHLAFYALLLVQPLSGYLSSSFSGYRTQWFGWALPHWGYHDAPLNELFTEVHVLGSIVLLVLIGLHLLGVLNHVLGGDASLISRMWPWWPWRRPQRNDSSEPDDVDDVGNLSDRQK